MSALVQIIVGMLAVLGYLVAPAALIWGWGRAGLGSQDCERYLQHCRYWASYSPRHLLSWPYRR